MIYTVTLNPSVDYFIYADSLAMGKTNRSNGEEIFFGGKGVNVSLMLKQFGIDSTVLGFIGGFTGDALKSHLDSVGLKTDFVKLRQGITRINVKMKTDCETEINASGPAVSGAEYEELLLKIDYLQNGDTLILSGKIPPSLADSVYAEICRRLSDKDIRIIVDAQDEALRSTLRYHPFLVKPNLNELEGLVGRTLENIDDVLSAAEQIKKFGAKNVLVSLGADGAVMLDEASKSYIQPAPPVKAINTVGAGDSMIAGFLSGLGKGYGYALRRAVLTGSATAAKKGFAALEDIEGLQKLTDRL